MWIDDTSSYCLNLGIFLQQPQRQAETNRAMYLQFHFCPCYPWEPVPGRQRHPWSKRCSPCEHGRGCVWQRDWKKCVIIHIGLQHTSPYGLVRHVDLILERGENTNASSVNPGHPTFVWFRPWLRRSSLFCFPGSEAGQEGYREILFFVSILKSWVFFSATL